MSKRYTAFLLVLLAGFFNDFAAELKNKLPLSSSTQDFFLDNRNDNNGSISIKSDNGPSFIISKKELLESFGESFKNCKDFELFQENLKLFKSNDKNKKQKALEVIQSIALGQNPAVLGFLAKEALERKDFQRAKEYFSRMPMAGIYSEYVKLLLCSKNTFEKGLGTRTVSNNMILLKKHDPSSFKYERIFINIEGLDLLKKHSPEAYKNSLAELYNCYCLPLLKDNHTEQLEELLQVLLQEQYEPALHLSNTIKFCGQDSTKWQEGFKGLLRLLQKTKDLACKEEIEKDFEKYKNTYLPSKLFFKLRALLQNDEEVINCFLEPDELGIFTRTQEEIITELESRKEIKGINSLYFIGLLFMDENQTPEGFYNFETFIKKRAQNISEEIFCKIKLKFFCYYSKLYIEEILAQKASDSQSLLNAYNFFQNYVITIGRSQKQLKEDLEESKAFKEILKKLEKNAFVYSSIGQSLNFNLAFLCSTCLKEEIPFLGETNPTELRKYIYSFFNNAFLNDMAILSQEDKKKVAEFYIEMGVSLSQEGHRLESIDCFKESQKWFYTQDAQYAQGCMCLALQDKKAEGLQLLKDLAQKGNERAKTILNEYSKDCNLTPLCIAVEPRPAEGKEQRAIDDQTIVSELKNCLSFPKNLQKGSDIKAPPNKLNSSFEELSKQEKVVFYLKQLCAPGFVANPVALIEEALKLDPNAPEIWLKIADMVKQGELKDTRFTEKYVVIKLNNLKTTDPIQKLDQQFLLNRFFQKSSINSVVDCINKKNQLCSDDFYALGLAYAMQEKYKDASVLLEKSKRAEALGSLALSYLLAKDVENAFKYYKNFIESKEYSSFCSFEALELKRKCLKEFYACAKYIPEYRLLYIKNELLFYQKNKEVIHLNNIFNLLSDGKSAQLINACPEVLKALQDYGLVSLKGAYFCALFNLYYTKDLIEIDNWVRHYLTLEKGFSPEEKVEANSLKADFLRKMVIHLKELNLEDKTVIQEYLKIGIAKDPIFLSWYVYWLLDNDQEDPILWQQLQDEKREESIKMLQDSFDAKTSPFFTSLKRSAELKMKLRIKLNELKNPSASNNNNSK